MVPTVTALTVAIAAAVALAAGVSANVWAAGGTTAVVMPHTVFNPFEAAHDPILECARLRQ